MTDAQHKRAERWAWTSLERLLVGWEGASISTTNNEIAAETRWQAREAFTAAKRTLAG